MNIKQNILSLSHLGLPIVIAQLGTIAQSFADTSMIGQYGTLELSSAGFVNNVFNLLIFFVLGLSYSTTPVVGSLWGQGRKDDARRALNNSLVVSTIGSAVLLLLLAVVYLNLDNLGQPSELMPYIRPYFITLTLSVPFIAVFNSFKQYSDATGDTRTPMWVMLISNVVNVVGNYILIFVCDMGLLGAGIATLLSRIFMAVWMWVKVGIGRGYDAKGIMYLTRKGLPISVQLCLEAGSFNVCALFMGWIGANALAAHQVMCVVGSLCFMVYYGIGAAAAVRISHYSGLKDMNGVRETAYVALGMTAVIGVVVTISVLVFHGLLFSVFTTSQEVITILVSMLPAFAAYQIGDLAQTVFANCLRAVEDVKSMMLSAFVAYIIVSIPCSYIFAFPLGMGAAGIWWGFPFGLSVAAILYYWRFTRYSLFNHH
ncbi:MAG: MATE family efflux transporter [Bacteroidaceae bacterium]|nr:MATE family efflux transporter [Bacteroidaceae bacterium]